MRFFQYLGHTVYLFFATLFTSHEPARYQLLLTVGGGARIMPPLSLVCMFLGFGLAFSVHLMLERFNLQQQAVLIAQDALIHDLIPILISFILCARAALMLIEEDHPLLRYDRDKVVLITIIPLIVGNAITAILLYAYVTTALLLSIYMTFDYFLGLDVSEYLLRLSESLNFNAVLTSIIKTLIYTLLASLIAGFYYYRIAARDMTIKEAVAKILLRGLFWLVVISGIIKIILP